MTYRHVKLPASGEKVTIRKGKVQVPDQPIIGYVEGLRGIVVSIKGPLTTPVGGAFARCTRHRN